MLRNPQNSPVVVFAQEYLDQGATLNLQIPDSAMVGLFRLNVDVWTKAIPGGGNNLQTRFLFNNDTIAGAWGNFNLNFANFHFSNQMYLHKVVFFSRRSNSTG